MERTRHITLVDPRLLRPRRRGTHTPLRLSPRPYGLTCPLCRDVVSEATACQGCGASYHQGCLREFGHTCATFGCGRYLAPRISLPPAFPPLTLAWWEAFFDEAPALLPG